MPNPILQKSLSKEPKKTEPKAKKPQISSGQTKKATVISISRNELFKLFDIADALKLLRDIAEETPMRQYAWLDFHGGIWLLLTGNVRDPVQTWVGRDVALSQLKEEGWKITGPHPKRLSVKQVSRQRIYGYARRFPTFNASAMAALI